MGLGHGADIVRNGLVLHLDAANVKSYPGTGTAWNDMSGNGNNGTLVNGVGYSADNKGTMTFDGVNDWSQFTNLKPSGARSYFILVKYNTVNSLTNGWALTGIQEGNAYTYIGIQNSGIFYYYAGANGGGLSSHILAPNTWYQQGFVLFGDGSRKLYLNGIEISSSAGSLGTTATSTFYVGRAGSHYINGNIPVVSYYNRALSGTEVQQNFEALRGRYGI